MPTQNAYLPEVVKLEGGLDYVTPRPTAPPGCLIDCYNFEVADRLGYKRADGCEPFDGRSVSNCYNSLYVINVSNATNANTNTWLSCTSNNISTAFAAVTAVNGNAITCFVFDIYQFYKVYSGVASTLYACGTANTFTVTNVKSAYINNGYTTIAQAISNIVSNYSTAYNRVQLAALPAVEGGTVSYTPPVGMNWFNNQLYLIRDLPSFVFDQGNTQIYPNDIIQSTSNLFYMLVRDVQLISGSYATNDAVGKVLYTVTSSATYVPPGNLGHSSGTNNQYAAAAIPDLSSLDIVRGSSTITGVCRWRTSVSGTVPSTWWANLAVSQDYTQQASGASTGGSYLDLEQGYTFSFNNGTSNGPPTPANRNANPTPAQILPAPSPANTPTSGNGFEGQPATVSVTGATTLTFASSTTAPNWFYQGTNGMPQLSLRTSGSTTAYMGAAMSGTGSIQSGPIYLSGFTYNDVPQDGIITGIRVDLSAVTTNYNASFPDTVTVSINPSTAQAPSTPKTTASIVSTSLAAPTTFTLGSNSDTWGINGGLKITDLPNLIVQLVCNQTVHGVNHNIELNYFCMTIYYSTSSSVFYFWNGTNDVQAILTNAYINPETGGSWAAGTATGVMQVAQVKPVASGARSQILTGDQVRTATGGGGLLYATVTSNMSFAGLPSLSACQTASSQYEIIDANFYENQKWDAMYGVNGAGRAWVWDGFYFRYIYTGLTDALDIPRHVAFHNFHLCLGYQSGSLLTSSPGAPEDFSGVDASADFGTGDEIHGLLRLNGTMLGVFCKNSIQALNGTDNTNFSMSVLSPYEGAIEYTVVNCGNKPVYCSYRGISTLDQTNAYGNYLGNRLSATITPWLLPRLTQVTPSLTIDSTNPSTYIFPNAGVQGPLFAMPCRSKNQYRLFFKDGYILTMTFVGQDNQAVFTIQQINFGSINSPDYLIPLAHSSGTDNKGLDRNHVSYYNPVTGKSTTYNGTKNYVWELDRGWGWGKAAIYGWFTTSHNFYDNPFQISNTRVIRLHGQSQGVGTLSVDTSSNYQFTGFKFGNMYGQTPDNSPSQDISLPKNGNNNSPATLSSDYQPLTDLASIAKIGRSFSLQFSSNPSTVEPPTVCQEYMIQITADRGDVA